jgi:hypothetical protein
MMAIHFLSTKNARSHLVDGISASDQAQYWFVAALIGIAYNYQSGWIGFRFEWPILIDIFTTIAITWIGIFECYRANGEDRGRDLLPRLAVLGVPLGIRLWLITLILYAINWYGFPWFMRTGLFANPERAWHFLSFFLWNATAAIFWWRMHYHIKVLNRIIKQSTTAASGSS